MAKATENGPQVKMCIFLFENGYIPDSHVSSPEGIRKLNLLVSAGVRLFVCFPGNFILDSPTLHFS